MKIRFFALSLCAFFLLSCGVAIAADGIDSAEGSDLPLNSQNTHVATLKMKQIGNKRYGVLDVANGANGVRIGMVPNEMCGPADSAGLIRLVSNQLEVCDGSSWVSASGGGKTCPSAQRTLTSGKKKDSFNLPQGKEGQLYYRGFSGGYYSYQCVNGAWVDNGLSSYFESTQCWQPDPGN